MLPVEGEIDWANSQKSKVDAAKPRSKEYILFDESFPGFGVRIFPSGVKSYIFQYRSGKHTRRMAIGKHGIITPHKARAKATELQNMVYDGHDPSVERKQVTECFTVAELCQQYLEEGCGHKKPSTISVDKGRIARHIIPLLGSNLVKDISTDDVEIFMTAIASGKTAADVKTGVKGGRAIVRGGKGTASRTVGLLGGIFTFAIRKGYVNFNPVRGVKKPKDGQRKRFLSGNEFKKTWKFLGDPQGVSVNSNAIPAIKLLLLTGGRKSEILKLKWSFVSFESQYLLLPDSKNG